MNDRERVLMNIAVDTSGSSCDTMERLECGGTLRFTFDRPSPQFVPPELADKIGMPMKPGDVIRCCTNPNHFCGIAELLEVRGHSDFLLREIGGSRTVNMGNESVHVLRFMSPSRLYTGVKHKIYKWASGKAFSERYNPEADYFKRCGGVEFDGDTLTIWMRSHIWGMEKKGPDGTTLHAQPRKFVMQWGDSTKLKDIVSAMIDQGFGDDFEYLPEKPTDGQAGYVSFTRDDISRVVQEACSR